MFASDGDDNFIQGMESLTNHNGHKVYSPEDKTEDAVKLLNDLVFRKVAVEQPRLSNHHTAAKSTKSSSFNDGILSSTASSADRTTTRNGVFATKLRESFSSNRRSSNHIHRHFPSLSSSFSISSVSTSSHSPSDSLEMMGSFEDKSHEWEDEFNGTVLKGSSVSSAKNFYKRGATAAEYKEEEKHEEKQDGNDNALIERMKRAENKLLIDQTHWNKGLKLYWMSNSEIV